MYKIVIERNFNGGSHVFDLSFDDLEDAKNAIKAILLSSDVISVKIK